MNTYLVILNPEAGKGKGRKAISKIESAFSSFGISPELVITERPGHASEIAKHSRADVVVAAGGDGTVNEVVNGLIGTTRVLGVLPIGSGNDLIKSIGIPRNLEQAVHTLLVGNKRQIDCGTVRCGNETTRYFVNGVGIGFDAAVAERTNQITYLSGKLVYVLAVFRTLGEYDAPLFRVDIDSTKHTSRNLLIAIGNGRCAGGGFYLTPDAVVDDGLFDICTIQDIPVSRVVSIMPRVMKGSHTHSKNVSMYRGRTVTVAADTPFYVHADGEVVGRNVRNVEVLMMEKAVTVFV